VLAGEVLAVLLQGAALPVRLLKLDERFERVARLLAAWQDPEAPAFRLFTGRQTNDWRLFKLSAAALGQPFRSPRYVAQALKHRTPQVKPVTRWTWSEWAGFRGREFRNPLLAEDDGPEGEAKALGYGLTHRREATPDFESFARLFAAAFARRDQTGAEASVIGSGLGSELSETRPAAQAVWDRLEVYRRHAQDLQAALEAILDVKRPAGQTRNERTQELAQRILLLFARREEALDEALRLERRVQGEFYSLLVRRHGPDERWESFQPEAEPRSDEEPSYLGSTPPPRWNSDWLLRLLRSASPKRKRPAARARPLTCRRPRTVSRDP
jgi:hypothetical protein